MEAEVEGTEAEAEVEAEVEDTAVEAAVGREAGVVGATVGEAPFSERTSRIQVDRSLRAPMAVGAGPRQQFPGAKCSQAV